MTHVFRGTPVLVVSRCEIEHPHHEPEDLSKFCKTVPRKCEIDFYVCLPVGGEFAVRIYTLGENDTTYNVCNYLFTDWDNSDGKPREVSTRTMSQQEIVLCDPSRSSILC